MPPGFSCGAKTMASLNRSLSGQIFAPSTAALGEDLLTWCREDFHVKTCPLQEPETASTASAPGSGWKWPGSFAKYDHASRSWKTRQLSLDGGLPAYSETWPRSGCMRDGECSALPPLAPTIDGNESGFLPTPTSVSYGSNRGGSSGRDGQRDRPSLETMARKGALPTPTAGDAKASGSRQSPTCRAHYGLSLTDWVRGDGGTGRMLPSPQYSDYKSGTGYDHGDKPQTPNLRHMSGGLLNPEFHCWMMGWPANWTSIESMHGPCDPALYRVQRLMCSGNGQVPQCAAEAWRRLIR